MMNLIKRMQRSRKLALAMLALSTLLFAALSGLWQGGQADSAWLRLLCPVLMLPALGMQLASLCVLLQKPRK
ncbi:hypothetical protein CXB49_12600 [Chromobacterium sp. ATCC 53434]|uniref:hypothetical protein n=1 Tax=Chromobacterium TaxID=535 RepID=UPI000C7825A9|nr:hypothetical protein [Chromobacterium sp. ATCC 53434]AUH51597.1 hypothetical protein CXB49_12600 [Chromobacterium sp. ATCC 53434]